MRGETRQATIDLAALRHNLAAARRHAAGRRVIPVVKADAYGHGALPVAQTLLEAGCEALAVVTVAEATALRDGGVEAPILAMGGVHDAGEAAEAAARALTPVVHDAGMLESLAAAAKGRAAPLPVQLEVDTGMRRMGVPADQAPALLEALAATPGLALAGVYTHLARADEPDLAPSRAQLEEFRGVLEAARGRGVDPGAVHFANSAGLLAGEALRAALPEAAAVRPGLMLYGARPAPHFDVALEPVMTLCARVVALRALRRGEGVGYGAQYRAERDTRVATLALGYEDGVPIAASNAAQVSIRGQRLPVTGRVSMDFLGVDVGSAPVEVGDLAVFFGAAGADRIPVEEAARACGTLAYELLVRVGRRVPRRIVGAP